MSSLSTAQTPPKSYVPFSGKTLLFVALAMIVVYFLAVVVYPMLFNSERVRGNPLIDQQPITPPPMK